MMIKGICGLIASLVLVANVNAGEMWSEDFEAVTKKAAELDRPILIDFTGSDWCGWCIRLKREVFDKETFKEYAKDNLVLFMADFPRRGKQSDAIKKQNQALQERYEIRGFPTILLVDSEGKVLGRTGYRPGGPEGYVEHLKELLDVK